MAKRTPDEPANFDALFALAVRTAGPPGPVKESVRRAVAGLVPDLALDYLVTMDEHMAGTYDNFTFIRRILGQIALLKQEINQCYWERRLSRNLVELRNLVTVADLIVTCAQRRKESRGLHQNCTRARSHLP